MSVSLSKNQTVSLSKDGKGLQRVFLGLGWDVVAPKKSGFLGGLFGGGSSGGESIDLDASCLMFDANKQIVETVWFRQLASQNGSVVHRGDNLTGEGDGDDEVIDVDLTKVDPKVQSLVFLITSFRGQTFEKVESAFCRLVNKDNNVELAKFNLSGKSPYTGQVMAKVSRENGAWVMKAIGEPGNGTTQKDLIPLAQSCL
jgi:tellurium resistance protein TerZ